MSTVENGDHSKVIEGIVGVAVGLSKRGLEPESVVDALLIAPDDVVSGIAYVSSNTKNANPDLIRDIVLQLKPQD